MNGEARTRLLGILVAPLIPIPAHVASLGVPTLIAAPDAPGSAYLSLKTKGLSLITIDDAGHEYQLRIDFTAGELDRRRRQRGELLFRAVGGIHASLTVLDATAGLGRDAFLLAARGCNVTACERSPVVWALLEDARLRALRFPELHELCNKRLQFVCADARAVLRAGPAPAVVLVDPMFPSEERTALTKQQMRTLRGLVGDDADAAALLAAALQSGAQRVVVKRMHAAPPIAGPPPSFDVGDRTARFDVYVAARAPARP